jgi:hypothetical protein
MKSKIVILLALTLLLLSQTFALDWEEVNKVVASDQAASDYFGYSVSISGDHAIVGVYKEDIDGITEAGAAYIFHYNGSNWTQQQKIVASDRAKDDYFGYSVAISGDYAIVGAYNEDYSNAGSAYIFHYDGSAWTQQQKIVASDRATYDLFGYSVSISGDHAIVGAYGEDEDALGANTLSYAGSAYLFHYNGSTWTQVQKIVASDRAASDRFGYTVSISGDHAIVGAYYEDEDASGENYKSRAGSAYLFHYNGSTWTQQQKIVASDRAEADFFGSSVAISGDYAIVGAYQEDPDGKTNAGSAYIFHYNGSNWTQQQKIVASDRAANDNFGYTVAISGDHAIVGAHVEDEDETGENTLSAAGSAYIFHYDGLVWTQQQKIVASDRAAYDYFGYSVSISGDNAIVGAYYEDPDGYNDAGSAYLFKGPEDAATPITLASFTAQTKNGVVDLAWETASETNNAAFVIYRNDDVLARVDGAGTTSETNNYVYVDATVVPGVSYTYVLADITYANDEVKHTDKAITVVILESDIPQEFSLEANYPNPFNPSTTISFQLSAMSDVKLTIYDMSGKTVSTLINDTMPAGYHKTNWDASDLSSGIYFYRLQAGDFVDTKKMIFMK